MIKNTDLIYFSGYVDGDGCFYCGKSFCKKRLVEKYLSELVVSSVNKEVLYFYKKIFGGSIIIPKKTIQGHKPIYYYHLKKRDALPIVKRMIPYLVEKVEEASIFLAFAASKEKKDKDFHIAKIRQVKDVGNLVSKYHKEEFETNRESIIPTKKDFVYLAGFIDAECSLNIQKYLPKDKPNYVYKIILQCNNTKAPVFKWLLQRFGGQIHFIDRRNNTTGKKNQLTWRLSGKALSKILDKIYPFLKHKKPVCKQLMNFYETTLTNGGARHTEVFRTQYAEIIKIREEIVENVHKLNLKGIQNSVSG